mmetsp:Transcript_37537/g.85993  ORF Transcript_37537/g.85993 Transcript_37537/m.85993 type:complete len:271 (-) Transcript_37537:946-1758(-)
MVSHGGDTRLGYLLSHPLQVSRRLPCHADRLGSSQGPRGLLLQPQHLLPGLVNLGPQLGAGRGHLLGRLIQQTAGGGDLLRMLPEHLFDRLLRRHPQGLLQLFNLGTGCRYCVGHLPLCYVGSLGHHFQCSNIFQSSTECFTQPRDSVCHTLLHCTHSCLHGLPTLGLQWLQIRLNLIQGCLPGLLRRLDGTRQGVHLDAVDGGLQQGGDLVDLVLRPLSHICQPLAPRRQGLAEHLPSSIPSRFQLIGDASQIPQGGILDAAGLVLQPV